MNREIKFRAWVKFPNKTNMDPTMQYNAQDWASFGKLCKDDSEVILMQYTGLKDKNGKEIYEGDIVKVVYVDGCEEDQALEVCWEDIGWHPFLGGMSDGYYAIKESKVIGNIYENPELNK